MDDFLFLVRKMPNLQTLKLEDELLTDEFESVVVESNIQRLTIIGFHTLHCEQIVENILRKSKNITSFCFIDASITQLILRNQIVDSISNFQPNIVKLHLSAKFEDDIFQKLCELHNLKDFGFVPNSNKAVLRVFQNKKFEKVTFLDTHSTWKTFGESAIFALDNNTTLKKVDPCLDYQKNCCVTKGRSHYKEKDDWILANKHLHDHVRKLVCLVFKNSVSLPLPKDVVRHILRMVYESRILWRDWLHIRNALLKEKITNKRQTRRQKKREQTTDDFDHIADIGNFVF